ncbi:putative mitochondrial large ribosomal subunit protein L16 [Trichodelitschia bisporula]|uniref:Putative mitochondrial large ribosomal subunit protein L16 n=1 Tax=Trichodelitschia bisporula TaxID=703511 RepID=A0A6G1HWP0_9PEZI|nr:putative mitochondrial large ribosomal subunit protein L16 [Trichodelitschia bisporula]
MAQLGFAPTISRTSWGTFTPAACAQPFSTSAHLQNWLIPKSGERFKSPKGRPRVATGGSTRGTTVVWGDYGIRLLDHGRRISAAHLKIAEDTIRKRLRGMKYRLFMRVAANIGVYKSGNDQRMGTGKGSFDHWATRIAVSRVVFELSGDVHEQVVRDAFRLAGNKLPGMWEFVKKGDPPVMGITKLDNGVTKEDLLRPRRKDPLPLPQDAVQTSTTLASSPSV